MPQPYSLDLRQRVIAACDSGMHTRREIAQQFQIGEAYNPIEPCWSKVEDELRSRAARTLEQLDQAVATAVDHVTPADARGWFRHCGYRFAPDP